MKIGEFCRHLFRSDTFVNAHLFLIILTIWYPFFHLLHCWYDWLGASLFCYWIWLDSNRALQEFLWINSWSIFVLVSAQCTHAFLKALLIAAIFLSVGFHALRPAAVFVTVSFSRLSFITNYIMQAWTRSILGFLSPLSSLFMYNDILCLDF